MSLSIGTNDSAMRASQAASIAARGMEASMERLSTGKRINSASDDAAGVAISSRLSAEVRGTNQSVRNALDAQALLDTAEGSHKEIENVLQRMREIAVQSANDTRCLIPWFDGAIYSLEWKEALWDKFVMGAPRPRTPSEQQYSDRKLRTRR